MAVDIQTIKRSHFKGYARVMLHDLRFHTGRQLDEKNVERLSRVFDALGCHRGDRRYALPVVVEGSVLHQTFNSGSCNSQCSLSQPAVDLPLISAPNGEKILCLHKKHRVHAAKQVLPAHEQWWTVEVYDSGERCLPCPMRPRP